MNEREVHLKLSDVKIDNDNLDYIKMTGEICGKLRDDLVKLFAIPVVSGSLPLASADKIMERIVSKYREANPHDRAIIAGICDEVLDRSGAFLGEVRTRAMAKQ